MSSDLDLEGLRPEPSVAQLTALARGTSFHKFKQMPVEQRCSCAAGRALSHAGVGNEMSGLGWEAVPDHERLAVGVARSWRVTSLRLWQEDMTLEQWRVLLGGLDLAGTPAWLL